MVELVDDLDGTVCEDISTVSFGLDGAEYEIDLTEQNAHRLRGALAAYFIVARRAGGRIKRGIPGAMSAGSTHRAADREKTKAIRAWAHENGWDIAERGRIPANVLTAYEEARAEATKPKTRRSRKRMTALAEG